MNTSATTCTVVRLKDSPAEHKAERHLTGTGLTVPSRSRKAHTT
jgi:hypothetical protein